MKIKVGSFNIKNLINLHNDKNLNYMRFLVGTREYYNQAGSFLSFKNLFITSAH